MVAYMETPKNLGQKVEKPMGFVAATQDKLSQIMGDRCEQIFDWTEKHRPGKYKILVTDNYVDKNYARTSNVELLKKDLKSWYLEWLKIIKEFDHENPKV
jgi:hypothetical protein